MVGGLREDFNGNLDDSANEGVDVIVHLVCVSSLVGWKIAGRSPRYASGEFDES